MVSPHDSESALTWPPRKATEAPRPGGPTPPVGGLGEFLSGEDDADALAALGSDLVDRLFEARSFPPTRILPGPGHPEAGCHQIELPRSFDPPPNFDFLEVLGGGGCGMVYKAFQRSVNRVVAIKVLTSPRPEWFGRFGREAQAIGRLCHPHVVQIFDIGHHAGVPFFTMEYCPGGSLAQRLAREGQLVPHEAADLVEKVARAVHHAHDRGILHRDLKPGNVLFARDGTPKVCDFGLAKNVQEDHLTDSGTLVGTPGYMSPEQIEGTPARIGPRSDVYSLGVILYQCLTGRLPFESDNLWDLFREVANHRPEAPRALNRLVPLELEAICLKCLERNPEDRYATALALTEDLQRFLDGRPIVGARPSRRRELARLARRHGPPLLVGLALLAVSATFGFALGRRSAPPTVVPANTESLESENRDLQAELKDNARLRQARGRMAAAVRPFLCDPATGLPPRSLRQLDADERQARTARQLGTLALRLLAADERSPEFPSLAARTAGRAEKLRDLIAHSSSFAGTAAERDEIVGLLEGILLAAREAGFSPEARAAS